MRPPIISTSWRLTARPSPLPPYWRVVDVSAWLKLWNSREIVSAVMPMPESVTLKRELDVVADVGVPPIAAVAVAVAVAGALAGRARRHALHGDDHLAAVRELHGVGAQVDQHLAEPHRIADQRVGHVGGAMDQQLQALVLGAQSDQVDEAVHHLVEPEGHPLQRDPAGLDAVEVQDVVDQVEQAERGAVHLLQVVALARVQAGLQRQVGHADDHVHRRTDLVAHAGQEAGLGAGRVLGRLHRPARLARGLLAPGDVDQPQHHGGLIALVVERHRRGAKLRPPRASSRPTSTSSVRRRSRSTASTRWRLASSGVAMRPGLEQRRPKRLGQHRVRGTRSGR